MSGELSVEPVGYLFWVAMRTVLELEVDISVVFGLVGKSFDNSPEVVGVLVEFTFVKIGPPFVPEVVSYNVVYLV